MNKEEILEINKKQFDLCRCCNQSTGTTIEYSNMLDELKPKVEAWLKDWCRRDNKKRNWEERSDHNYSHSFFIFSVSESGVYVKSWLFMNGVYGHLVTWEELESYL